MHKQLLFYTSYICTEKMQSSHGEDGEDDAVRIQVSAVSCIEWFYFVPLMLESKIK